MPEPETMTVHGLCGDCPFWEHPVEGIEATEEYGVGGICRAGPPMTIAGGAHWPVTGEREWCGRHPLRDAHWKLKAQQCLDALQEQAAGTARRQ